MVIKAKKITGQGDRIEYLESSMRATFDGEASARRCEG